MKALYRSLFFTLLLCASAISPKQSLAQPPSPAYIDSFRMVIVDGLNYNEKIEITDTLQFIQLGLYSFVNFDNTSTFHDLFMCYEPGYNRLPNLSFELESVKQMHMIRDIRWLFLYYLDQYVVRKNTNQQRVFKSSLIQLHRTKDLKEISIYGDEGFDTVIKLYQDLIVAANKKTFLHDVVQSRNTSLMEFVGYQWSVR